MSSVKLRQGDTVAVIAGRDKKKTGKVLKVDRDKGRVFVEGINIIKKTQKPRREGEKGAIIEVEASIDISNVMLRCLKCGPVRARVDLSSKQHARVCAKCGGVL